MPIRLAAAAAALFVLSSPALADSKRSAEELARLLMPKKTWDEGLQSLARSVQARMQTHPGANLQYPPDFPKKVRAELDAVLPYETLVQMHTKQLGASYTEPELKELIAFYRSPTGQKSLQVMPQVSEKVSLETEQRVNAQLPKIMERLGAMAKTPGGSSSKDRASGAKAKGAVSRPAP